MFYLVAFIFFILCIGAMAMCIVMVKLIADNLQSEDSIDDMIDETLSDEAIMNTEIGAERDLVGKEYVRRGPFEVPKSMLDTERSPDTTEQEHSNIVDWHFEGAYS